MKTRRFLTCIALAMTACFSLPAVADVVHASPAGSFTDVATLHQAQLIAPLVAADTATQVANIGSGTVNMVAEMKVTNSKVTDNKITDEAWPDGSGNTEIDGFNRPISEGVLNFGDIYTSAANTPYEVGWRS